MRLVRLIFTAATLIWCGSTLAQSLSFSMSEPWGRPWDDDVMPFNGKVKLIKQYGSWTKQDGSMSDPALEYEFEFDQQRRLTKLTQAWGGREPARVTEFSYTNGQRTQERRIKPDQETVSQKFDGQGCLMEWRRDVPGKSSFSRRYRCEKNGSNMRRTEVATPAVWSEFDAQGRVTSMVTDGALIIRSDGTKRPDEKRVEYGLSNDGKNAMITAYGFDAGKETIRGREFRDLTTGALLSAFVHTGFECCYHESYEYRDYDPTKNWLTRETYQKNGDKLDLKKVSTRTIEYWR